MKRKILILLAMIVSLAAFTAVAGAELYLSNGSYSAYIGENDYLYLTDAVGTTKVLQVACSDLLSMTDTQLYCRTSEGKLYAIELDGSATSIVSAAPTQAQLDQVTAAPVYTLDNGTLSLTGADGKPVVVATNVTLACANTTNLYYIETVNGSALVKTVALNLSESMAVSTVLGPATAGSLTMNATEDAVTIVGPDHSVLVLDLASGSFTYLAAVSQDVERALAVGEKLFYYTLNEDGSYHMSSRADSGLTVRGGVATANAGLSLSTATPSPTPTATPRPTATPTPYRTSAPTATAASDKYQTLRYGNTGTKVRRMQQRLSDLSYPVGTVDGSFGDTTLFALHLFQDAIGYREHNYASSEVLEKLYSKKAPTYDPYMGMKRGSSGTTVLILQTSLLAHGFDPGTLDGVYGTKTETAVLLYQMSIGLPGTGEADKTTLIYLYDPNFVAPTIAPTVSPYIPPVYVPTYPPADTPTTVPTTTPIVATTSDL